VLLLFFRQITSIRVVEIHLLLRIKTHQNMLLLLQQQPKTALQLTKISDLSLIMLNGLIDLTTCELKRPISWTVKFTSTVVFKRF
jgi:hypothetical protein